MNICSYCTDTVFPGLGLIPANHFTCVEKGPVMQDTSRHKELIDGDVLECSCDCRKSTKVDDLEDEAVQPANSWTEYFSL